MNEALEVSTCYIDGWTGDYDYVLFCASSTDASHIYPCSSATKKYGHKSSESKCYNK